ncbi:MAG TPA: hypothetical protein VGJ56_27930 [Reyranella sp.]|jgi:hypothetical protein
MDKFGKVAIKATRLLISGIVSDPREAWHSAAEALLSYSTSTMRKHCPRSAYLGLCEEGLVKGASKGPWLTSNVNKLYAVRAVQELRIDRTWLTKPKLDLWRVVSRSPTKTHNSQIDEVFGLWEDELITQEPSSEPNSN